MKFCCYESQVLQEMTNFGDYPRDFRPLSGHWEIWSKIWSLLDCPRELTALGIPSWSPVHLFTHPTEMSLVISLWRVVHVQILP